MSPKSNSDADLKQFDRFAERHIATNARRFRIFVRKARKRDWFWVYYYQCRIIFKMNHEQAIFEAGKSFRLLNV